MSNTTNGHTSFPGHGMLFGSEMYALGLHPISRKEIHLTSADDYRIWHATIVAGKKGRCWRGDTPIAVYINYGKWVANCSSCGKGMLTRPDWGLACCIECGAWFDGNLLVFPQDELILQALLARPDRDTQHWDDKQTANDLIRENKEILNL